MIEHDVSRPFRVDGPVDAIAHLASPASPIDFLRLPIQILKVNSIGTYHALGMAKDKARASCWRPPARCMATRTSTRRPRTTTATSTRWAHAARTSEAKRFAEAITMAYHRMHGVQVRIVRIFNTYGPRMRLDDGRVVPNFVSQSLRGLPLTAFGDGEQTRSFCYVDDLVDGIMRLMASDVDGPVNIGNPLELSMNEFARRINALTGNPAGIALLPLPAERTGDPSRRCPDITRATTLLGWRPNVSLDDGLARTMAWFKAELAQAEFDGASVADRGGLPAPGALATPSAWTAEPQLGPCEITGAELGLGGPRKTRLMLPSPTASPERSSAPVRRAAWRRRPPLRGRRCRRPDDRLRRRHRLDAAPDARARPRRRRPARGRALPGARLAAAAAFVPFGPRLAVAVGGRTARRRRRSWRWRSSASASGTCWRAAGRRRRPARQPSSAAALWSACRPSVELAAPSPGTALLEVVRWGVFAAALAAAGTLSGRAGRGWGIVVVAAILASGAVEAVYGGRLALAGVGPKPFLLPGGRARAFGDFGQPNPFGGYMNLVWPLGIALAAELAWPCRAAADGRRRTGAEVRLLAPLAVGAAARIGGLALSWSRGAWLAAAAAAGTMAALRCAAGLRRPFDPLAVAVPYLALTIALAALAFGAAPSLPAVMTARVATITGAAGAGAAQRDLAHADVTNANFSTIERLAHWDAAARMWADRPWLGQGPGHYPLRYAAYRLPRWPYDLGHAHNAYLNALAETGLLGLAALAALMAAAAALAVRAAVAPRSGLEGALGIGLAGSLAAVAVHSVFDVLWVHDMTVLLAIQIGLTLAARTWPAAPAASPPGR
ncbi:MAG: GDP-mannose 4,6-dehydratase [Anaerolineae bacterium]